MTAHIIQVNFNSSAEKCTRIDVEIALNDILLALRANGKLKNDEEFDKAKRLLFTPGISNFQIHKSVAHSLVRFGRRNRDEDIVNFFSTEEKPVGHNEFFDFWESLSIYERLVYLNVPLD